LILFIANPPASPTPFAQPHARRPTNIRELDARPFKRVLDRLEIGRPRRSYAGLVIRDDSRRDNCGPGEPCLRQFDERSRGSALGWRHFRTLTPGADFASASKKRSLQLRR
jgi:hypothetical protein